MAAPLLVTEYRLNDLPPTTGDNCYWLREYRQGCSKVPVFHWPGHPWHGAQVVLGGHEIPNVNVRLRTAGRWIVVTYDRLRWFDLEAYNADLAAWKARKR